MGKFVQLLLVLTWSFATYAEEVPESQRDPCKKVMEACKAAQSVNSNPKVKKGLFKNCMRPLLDMPSQPVEGVHLDPQVIAACREKKQSRKK
jgi:hypothetical protein